MVRRCSWSSTRLTGSLGNLVSTLIRQVIGSNPLVHSAGGSVVILGLVGMCAIAGWRSNRRMGRLLARQMGIVLFLTAILGLALPNFIDNWGHAGGALVGGVIGFLHPWLLASQSKPVDLGSGTDHGADHRGLRNGPAHREPATGSNGNWSPARTF